MYGSIFSKDLDIDIEASLKDNPIENGFDQPDMILLCSNYPYTNKLQPLLVNLK